MLRVVGMSIGLFGIVAGYGIGHGMLVGGRCPTPREDKAMPQVTTVEPEPDRSALDAIQADLQATRGVVQGMEALLRVMSQEIEDRKSAIAILRNRFTALERRYPGGIPPEVCVAHARDVSRYNLLAKEYNLKVQRYKKLWSEYSGHRDQLNRQVEAADYAARALGDSSRGASAPLTRANTLVSSPQS